MAEKKNPSRRQKEILARNGYRINEWIVLSESNATMEIKNIATGSTKIIPKNPIKRK